MLGLAKASTLDPGTTDCRPQNGGMGALGSARGRRHLAKSMDGPRFRRPSRPRANAAGCAAGVDLDADFSDLDV
jgi:hypothetical protein